ncbi:hypothetical protein GCM10029964_088060 [Kibdelosporangium lantanae]
MARPGFESTQVNAEIAGFANRTAIRATDYAAALRGARQNLAERAAQATANGGQPPCQALLWFTDGAYDPLDGAPNNDAEIDRGTHELCDPGGIIDQLRRADVPLLTVALTVAPDFGPPGQDDLRKLTLDCGRDAGPGSGVYLAADHVADLVDAFADLAQKVRIAGEPVQLCPADATCSFQLDALMRNFYVLIHTGGAPVNVSLQPPGAAPVVVLGRDGAAKPVPVAGANLRWAWFGEDIVTVSGELPRATDTQWTGTWRVGFDGPVQSPGGRVYLVGDLVPQVVGEPKLMRGARWEFDVRTVRSSSSQADAELAAIRPELRVTISDGADRRPATTVPGPSGTTAVTFDPPPEWRSAEVGITLQLTVRTSAGVDISPPPVVRTVRVTTPLTLDPSSLALSTVVGKGATTGTVHIAAPTAGGCVWVPDQPRFTDTPVHVTVAAEPDATAGDQCLRVDRGQQRDLALTFSTDRGWPGRNIGSVVVKVRPDSGAEYDTEVPVSFASDIERGADFWATWAATIAATALPLVLVLLLNWLVLARFHKSRPWRVARIKVRLDTDGHDVQVRPIDGDPDWPRTQQFERVSPPPRKKFTNGLVTFRVRTSLGPFAPPHTRISTGRRNRLATRTNGPTRRLRVETLNLAGTVVVVAGPAPEVIIVLGGEELTSERARELRNEARSAAARLVPLDEPASVVSSA